MKRWVYIETAEPTKAEREVLGLLFKGKTYAEIGEARHCCRKTVETHISRLISDTGTRNSRELIYEALSRGWITPPARLA